jgi:hypothetical protein
MVLAQGPTGGPVCRPIARTLKMKKRSMVEGLALTASCSWVRAA